MMHTILNPLTGEYEQLYYVTYVSPTGYSFGGDWTMNALLIHFPNNLIEISAGEAVIYIERE